MALVKAALCYLVFARELTPGLTAAFSAALSDCWTFMLRWAVGVSALFGYWLERSAHCA